MGTGTKKKKYRIIDGFVYKGHDGKAKPIQWVRISPGEELPKLDPNQIQKLLVEQKICELDSYGMNIPNKRVIEMTHEEIDRLFQGKTAQGIMGIISSGNFSRETLCRMLVFVQKMKVPQLITFLEQKIEG